jgi:hypothetical protein
MTEANDMSFSRPPAGFTRLANRVDEIRDDLERTADAMQRASKLNRLMREGLAVGGSCTVGLSLTTGGGDRGEGMEVRVSLTTAKKVLTDLYQELGREHETAIAEATRLAHPFDPTTSVRQPGPAVGTTLDVVI